MLTRAQTIYGSVWTQHLKDTSDVRRSPAILRTNRQIYNEASSLFYSELDVRLQTGDVVWISLGKDFVKPRKTQWTVNELDDTPHADPSGSTLRPKPKLDAVMGPHMLARFRKITFETDFEWEIMALKSYGDHLSLPNRIPLDQNALDLNALEQIAPDLFINTIRTADLEEDARHSIHFYRHSTFVHRLIEILSKSSDIIRLDMLFDVRPVVYYEFNYEGDLDARSRNRKMVETCERAVADFLHSGILAPLEKLSNVQSIRFRFAGANSVGKHCELESNRHSVLVDLKQKIERNHAFRNDSRVGR